MRLVDANVFIYAVGRSDLYRDPCRQILDAAANHLIDVNTDIEVFQDILHHFQVRCDTYRGTQTVREAMVVFPDALTITSVIMGLATDILLAHPHLQSRDAVHAAVVLEHRLEGIISADRAFDGIHGVRRFDPRDI